ncbi:MAG: carbohydrate kinase family protein [Candidatus Bathycorpusculaceae bacterium]
MSTELFNKLKTFLEGEIRKLSVVVMPDFFTDRLVILHNSPKTFIKQVDDVVGRKGGSIDGITQMELRGGNAVNTAAALAALGVNVTPIICTNKLGQSMVKFYLKKWNLNLSHVKIFEKPSLTTALEFKTESGKANVMLRDVGSLADFGPQSLNEKDFEIIENADYVCVFNWAGTRRFGTELAGTVFKHVKEKGKGKTYYDPADPTPNKEKIPKLVENVLQSQYVDVLSVNENEAYCYASQLSNKTEKLEGKLSFEELAKESARILAKKLSARIDLHATSFAATFTKKKENVIPAFQIPVLRATGAGDAWNAGNIFGDACGLSDDCRLMLANAIAAYYISNPDGLHPTKRKLIEFLEKIKRSSV